jgi:hypothetical protein
MPRSKGLGIGFWIATALFCLQMGFTAYAQPRLPQVAAAFTRALWCLSYFFLAPSVGREASRRGCTPELRHGLPWLTGYLPPSSNCSLIRVMCSVIRAIAPTLGLM